MESLSQIELLRLSREKLNKEKITFVQIGASDGILNDVAVNVLNEKDSGYFFEPMKDAYDLLIQNKKNFINSKFFNTAILPEIIKDNNVMNILSDSPLNQGSSFGNTVEYRIIDKVKVNTITIYNFIKYNNINSLDFLFCDAEGIDHLIINEFLEFLEPKVMFFETCAWKCVGRDDELIMTDGKKITIPSRDKIKDKLIGLDYYVIDYYEHIKYPGQDMIAIKNNLLL